MKRWEIKELARSLRRKGLSYSEIRTEIPLAKSTVSNWCKDIGLTKSQILRLSKLKIGGSYEGCLKGAKVNQEKTSSANKADQRSSTKGCTVFIKR